MKTNDRVIALAAKLKNAGIAILEVSPIEQATDASLLVTREIELQIGRGYVCVNRLEYDGDDVVSSELLLATKDDNAVIAEVRRHV